MTNSRKLTLVAGGFALLIAVGTTVAVAGIDNRATTSPIATATAGSKSTTEDRTSSTAVPTGSSSATSTLVAAPRLTAADAERIARDHVGGGQVVRTEQETEHGRLVWDVRIDNAGTRYDVDVDAETGAIGQVDTGQGGTGVDDRGADDRGGHGRYDH
jgi:uncharacterized membrane protein YkoI